MSTVGYRLPRHSPPGGWNRDLYAALSFCSVEHDVVLDTRTSHRRAPCTSCRYDMTYGCWSSAISSPLYHESRYRPSASGLRIHACSSSNVPTSKYVCLYDPSWMGWSRNRLYTDALVAYASFVGFTASTTAMKVKKYST